MSRVDGPAKVTGQAKYAAEFNVPGLAHGFVVSSTIAKGRIKKIDRSCRDRSARCDRRCSRTTTGRTSPQSTRNTRTRRPRQDCRGGHFTTRRSSFLASRSRSWLPRSSRSRALPQRWSASSMRPKRRSPISTRKSTKPFRRRRSDCLDGTLTLAAMSTRLCRGRQSTFSTQYRTPIEHHNPMENFGCTAVWEDDGRLIVYDKTQGAPNCHKYLCNIFGLGKRRCVFCLHTSAAPSVRASGQIIELFLAVLAAIGLEAIGQGRAHRAQMFTIGYRPQTIQTLSLGAEQDGSLVALKHEAITNASRFEDYQEPTVPWTGALYHCDNSAVSSKLARVDLFTPCDMRAPGGAVGVYAIECAMDELSYAVGIDPLELRLKNYSEMDQNEGKPFCSKALKDCYHWGAERFGWSKRKPEPPLDARGTRARGLRHGDRHLGGIARAGERESDARSRRHARNR